ncbi:MAG TPA: hypothetical protein VKB25_12840 [Conexibacter sp.]|nr:hypothetical protein [Conexibacter sp.]
MSRPRRVLTVVACAASAGALSAPAALAAPSTPSNGQGVVLSLASGHGVRIVDRSHRVDNVRVSSTRGLQRGDVVSVRKGRARVSGRVRKVSFLGRVVRSSGQGAVVQLGDGSSFKLRGGGRPHGHRARPAGKVTVDFQGLVPGQTLLVTIATDEQGNVAITISVVSSPTDIGDGASDEGDCAEDDWADEVDGAVTALAGDASSLTVAPDDGSAATTIPVGDASLLEGIEVGDDVVVMLDEDGTAIDVELLDWSEDPGDDGDDDE